MNVNLRGKTLQIIDNMVSTGFANTKSEAIRLAILNFGKEHEEEIQVSRKIAKINSEIAKGKRRLLTAEEALGAYAKHLKG